MNYFANESDVRRAGDFELQNRLDRIELSAGTITRDEAGLVTVRALREHLDQIEQQLIIERSGGRLPKAIELQRDTDAGNAFNMPERPR